MNRHGVRGTTAVEFAIVIATLLVVIFGVLDLSRIVYLRMTLEEGVRRAARLAAVCPPGSPLIVKAALFQDSSAQGVAIPGATIDNVNVNYLNANSIPVDPTADFTSVRFVRVSLDGVSVSLFIPFITGVFSPTNISSTTSAESLGVLPAPESSAPLPCN
jgi:Flp pilus assembly protein TadG